MDWKVHTYAQLSSTQDYVRELAEEGLPEGIVIQCLTQTKGRGRHGNQWQSPIGNLYMSVLLRPECTADKAGQISFVAALALSAAIDEVLDKPHTKTLKWPNDILIDGLKCAGILLESDLGKDGRVESLALGMGVNIMAPPEGSIGLQQVSKGKQVPIHPFRDIVLSHLAAYYQNWQKNGFGDIRSAWLEQAHGLGKTVTARLPDREYTGLFTDLDQDGALLLRQDEKKVIAVNAGEVYFPQQ